MLPAHRPDVERSPTRSSPRSSPVCWMVACGGEVNLNPSGEPLFSRFTPRFTAINSRNPKYLRNGREPYEPFRRSRAHTRELHDQHLNRRYSRRKHWGLASRFTRFTGTTLVLPRESVKYHEPWGEPLFSRFTRRPEVHAAHAGRSRPWIIPQPSPAPTTARILARLRADPLG